MTTTIRNKVLKLSEQANEIRAALYEHARQHEDDEYLAMRNLGVDVTNLSYDYEKIIDKLMSKK